MNPTVRKLFRILRAPLTGVLIFYAACALLNVDVDVPVLASPSSYSEDQFLGRNKPASCAASESCNALPCDSAEVLSAPALNNGDPIYGCYVEHLPSDVCFQSEIRTEPNHNQIVDVMLKRHITMQESERIVKEMYESAAKRCTHLGRRITVSSFARPHQELMFYVQKDGQPLPAYSYEELAALIGGIKTEESAAAYLTAILKLRFHESETKLVSTDDGFFVQSAFSGSSSRCAYLSRFNGQLSADGTFARNFDSNATIHHPEPGCPSD